MDNNQIRTIREKLIRCHFDVFELHPWELSLLRDKVANMLRWHATREKFRDRIHIDALEAYAVLRIGNRLGLSLDGFRTILTLLFEDGISYLKVREADYIRVEAA